MTKRHYILLTIFLVIMAGILYHTLPDYGITWDEPLYYQAGDAYVEWTVNILDGIVTGDIALWLNADAIGRAWIKNAQHPPLVKIVAGITKYIFVSSPDRISAYRISEIFWFLSLLLLVFYIAYKTNGVTAAWFAILATATMPRLFADAHLVELDLPLSVMWIAVVYCFYRGIENWKWSLLTGITFGLALSTKVTAIFLIIPLIIWAQVIARKSYTNNLFSMFFIGIPIFILCWPWLWHDTFERIVEFYRIFLTFKSPLKTFYFGHAYSSTPWHYPLVMLILTTPLPVLALSFWGFWNKKDQTRSLQLRLLLLVNILFFIILFSLPGTLVIDGIRYFLPVVPMLVILSGIGFDALLKKINQVNKIKINVILFTVFLFPSVYWTIYLHPNQLSYYNLLVGGSAGAEKIGMETTYWGEVLGPKEINWINQNIPQNAKVKILPVYPGNGPAAALSFYPDVVVYYQSNAYIRRDIQFFAEPPYDYFILISRQGLFDDLCWRLYRTEKPVYSVKYGNLQLIGIYKANFLGEH
jgi:4-amino-4-deoxy-L-arabinose transferase-like glycosyltransferase